MALAVDAPVAAHDAHREHSVRAQEPSSSGPIAPALTVVGRDRSHARRERSRTLGIASGFATHVHAGENGLAVARAVPRPGASHRTSLATGHATVCWKSATRGQRADEDRGSQGLPGVDDRSYSG